METAIAESAATTKKAPAMRAAGALEGVMIYLVPLEGTPKQIAWGQTIRKQMVEALVNDPRFNGEEGLEAVLRADHSPAVSGYILFGAYLKAIILQASAAWWIEHRDATGILDIVKSEMKKAVEMKKAAKQK